MIVQQGDTGQFVKDIQTLVGADVDGVFGPKTTALFKDWQRSHGLVPDGVPGPVGLAKMGLLPSFGIDVSHWQGDVNWQTAKATVQWCAFKLTNGKTGVDKEAIDNLTNSRAAKLPGVGYHFADLGDSSLESAAVQALHTVKTAGRPMVLALDMEKLGVPDGLSPSILCAWALKWLQTAQAESGRDPWFYTDWGFLHDRLGGGTPELAAFPLWIARYRGEGAVDPGDLGAWSRWTAWQRSSSGRVGGVQGSVDTDWLYGDPLKLIGL